METEVADADLLRVEELPSDNLGGASGEKRKFRLEFIGKTPNELFPYTLANEVVSSYLGMVLGFNIPWVIPYIIDKKSVALILWMRPAAKEQQGPPPTSRELKELLEKHRNEVHGAIILDLFLANTDRSFGPERRNMAIDDATGRILLFDFGNALFYRPREHSGIKAGIERLRSVESNLAHMFDKAEKNPDNYYFQLLDNWEMAEQWCARIADLPEYVLRNAIDRIPEDIEPPTKQERDELFLFLQRRQKYILKHICDNPDLFPNLPRRSAS